MTRRRDSRNVCCRPRRTFSPPTNTCLVSFFPQGGPRGSRHRTGAEARGWGALRKSGAVGGTKTQIFFLQHVSPAWRALHHSEEDLTWCTLLHSTFTFQLSRLGIALAREHNMAADRCGTEHFFASKEEGGGRGVTAALLRRVAVVPALHTAAKDNEGKRVNAYCWVLGNRAQALPDIAGRGGLSGAYS